MSRPRNLATCNGSTIADFDLNLELLLRARKPGQRLSHRLIAEVCGCSRSTIFYIEQHAIQKMKRAALASGL